MIGAYFISIANFIRANRSFSAFVMMFVGIGLGDVVSVELARQPWFVEMIHPFSALFTPFSTDLSFAPEVWLGILALVLGTLIVTITIAAQAVPRLIDLFMDDWLSLGYAWFLIFCSAHAIFLNKIPAERTSSIVYNNFVLMPLSILAAFPYIYYVLGRTKPATIIAVIVRDNLNLIASLTKPSHQEWLKMSGRIERKQHELLEFVNQLDGVSHFVSFKEAKAQIIMKMTELMGTFLRMKNDLPPEIFTITQTVRSDIAFQTLGLAQFTELEETKTFYEQKCFRVLADIYNGLLQDSAFDLASMCGSEMRNIGRVAIETEQAPVLNMMLMRFNTMMRFAIKHAVANDEARNLYNLAYHYRTFIEDLARANKVDTLKQAIFYQRFYGSEMFRHSKAHPPLYFINDVFTAEMKRILILINELGWDLAIQRHVLLELLEMDNPGGLGSEEKTFHAGVRTLQSGLALFYLERDVQPLVDLIVADIAQELKAYDMPKSNKIIGDICNRLDMARPTFWEDTDRGNVNIYFSPYKQHIPRFRELLNDSLRPAIPDDL